MTDVWSQRAEAFRLSPTHREGPDLDLLVDWCEPGPGVKALDVGAGGGHVARRLRTAGCAVVTLITGLTITDRTKRDLTDQSGA